MNPTPLSKYLKDLGACDPALAWTTYGLWITARDLWAQCHRADWMLWLACRVVVEPKLVTKTLLLLARRCVPELAEGHRAIAKTIIGLVRQSRGDLLPGACLSMAHRCAEELVSKSAGAPRASCAAEALRRVVVHAWQAESKHFVDTKGEDPLLEMWTLLNMAQRVVASATGAIGTSRAKYAGAAVRKLIPWSAVAPLLPAHIRGGQ